MAPARDFYEILGVPKTAGQDEIQRAYRKLARKYHPDVNKAPDAEDRFKEASEAYAVLSDPEQRKRYDAFGEDFRRVPPDVDPETWARARAGAGAGGRARAGAGAGGFGGFGGFGTGGEEVDLEDLLGGIFGGRAGRGRRPGGFGWGPMPGADQEAELEIGLDEAYHGGHRTIRLNGRTIDVNIPVGVTDGQRIRLAGQGGRGGEGGQPGDLYLIVRITPDPRYRVDGRDVTVRLPLAPWEAALGTTAPVGTPGGDAKVKVPPGSSCGRRLRLRGRGLPNPHGGPGDLYAEVQIKVPPQPSAEERRLFEELAAKSSFDPRRRS
ncbi:DnaJ C-terminal domain-containing protein [Actinoallomurus liliacearum]|uniref:DnaJ C-terminal domain-containing protein n=1 Tax=Actinoallomurus liliacearum TaxID=1080073 RepID=A0ABP8TUU4_9ACTN